MITPHAVFILCRFVHDTAAMLVWGGFGYLLTCVSCGLARHTARRLEVLTALAVVATIATAACTLSVRTAMIGGGWGDAVDPSMLWAVISATSVGTAWLTDFAASLLLGGALFLRPPLRIPALVLSSGLVLASLVLTGHAMMHEGWLGYFQQANDLVHILASGAWLGALLPLVLILRGLSTTAFDHDRAVALKRFSGAGMAAVCLILVTGILNTLLIVGGWPLNWTSPYQMLLCLKIGTVLVMIGLASRNRFILSPCLTDGHGDAATAIRRAAIGEIALGATAILLVAIFGTLNPGHGIW